jgi:hypothetical protein
MKRQKTTRRRADDGPAPPAAAARRRWWLGVSLAAVVALQVLGSWSRLDRPFLDSRLHYDYDNADFGFRTRNGLRNHDLRSQFGVTINRYAAWGETTGKPKYYTDHPFLFKTLLQLYARVAGVSEWTTRSFYLGVAIATVAGFFWLLAQTTRSAWSAAAGAATLAALPLFAVYQVCVKFEADGIAVAVWVFVAFAGYLRRGTRAWRILYAVLVGAAFLAHWTAILFVVFLAVYQRLPGRSERARELFRTTIWASAIGGLALVALMSYLQSGSVRAIQVLARAFTIRSAPIPLGAWAARQLAFLPGNFTWPLALASLPMVWMLVRELRRSGVRNATKHEGATLEGLRLLAVFIAGTFSVACLWLAGFRQGSFIHSYWQYWLCLPIAALVAASVDLARTRSARWIARGLACGMVVWLWVAAQRVQQSVVADQLGTPDDIAFLGALRADRFDRLAFVPVAESPLNSWFQGPLFLYYTDRPIVVAAKPGDLRAGDKVLVLRYEQRSVVEQQVEKWAGLQLGNEMCGRRICAYDVK